MLNPEFISSGLTAIESPHCFLLACKDGACVLGKPKPKPQRSATVRKVLLRRECLHGAYIDQVRDKCEGNLQKKLITRTDHATMHRLLCSTYNPQRSDAQIFLGLFSKPSCRAVPKRRDAAHAGSLSPDATTTRSAVCERIKALCDQAHLPIWIGESSMV